MRIFGARHQNRRRRIECKQPALCRRGLSPDIKGHPLTDRGLAALLRPYGIRSKTVRIGDLTSRGYMSADFVDAWNRYLPAGDERHKRHKRHSVENTGKHPTHQATQSDTQATQAPDASDDVSDVCHSVCHSLSNKNNDVSDVSDVSLGAGKESEKPCQACVGTPDWLSGRGCPHCKIWAIGQTERSASMTSQPRGYKACSFAANRLFLLRYYAI